MWMMKFSRWTEHPRLLAALALVFALVPAWLAMVTYRDAREKDERLFQTSAQVLKEQLQSSFQRADYFLDVLRRQAGNLPDGTAFSGPAAGTYDWKAKLPHLLAFGFAAQKEGQVMVQWMSEARVPVAAIGDDLTGRPGIAAAVKGPSIPGALPTFGGMSADHRMLVVMTVLKLPVRTPRGYVVGWLDLDALCRQSALPLLVDGVLLAAPLIESDALPAGAERKRIGDGSAQWTVAIRRGPHFSREYGAPAPWLAFFAVGLSAVPLLVLAMLAGRSTKLRAALTAEREVLRQQRYFTQSVSHEFRTPLGIILSGTDLLDQYAAHLTPERREEVLREIRDNTRHMSDMVERILLLGRMESGKLACTPAPVNMQTLCEDAARKVMTAAPGSSISAITPDQDAPLDAALLGSILDNLLSNAVKYSAPGQPVTLSAVMEEKRVVLAVRDEGIGIPPEDLPRVCDPFHRCANVGDVPGTGLGLAIAQRCAALHGGTLKIESTQGSGTTATVSIPLS